LTVEERRRLIESSPTKVFKLDSANQVSLFSLVILNYFLVLTYH